MLGPLSFPPSARGVVIGLDVDFTLENPITVVPMCYKYVFWHLCSYFMPSLLTREGGCFFGGLNEISGGKRRQEKLWILGREASMDGFGSADGKLLYA